MRAEFVDPSTPGDIRLFGINRRDELDSRQIDVPVEIGIFARLTPEQQTEITR